MALSIKFTRTVPLYPRAIFVQWDLVDPTESGTYVFDVYRGGSAQGPWTLLRGGTPDSFNYRDTLPVVDADDVNALSLSRGIYYRIVVTPPSGTGNQAEAVSIVEPTLDGRQRLLKRKMLRDMSIALRKLNGTPVALCKRMHWGLRCTKCYDRYTKEVVRSNCTTCMGTGFNPGYHIPVITLARRTPTAVETAMAPEGKADVNVLQVWMLDVPRVEEDDVLVFLSDNRRFQVKKMLPTELKTVTIHQKLIVSELARSSVEYRIVVDPTRNPPLF